MTIDAVSLKALGRVGQATKSIAGAFAVSDAAPPVYATGLTAVVLLGTNSRTQDPVAIKVVDKEKLIDEPENRVEKRSGMSELRRAQLEVFLHQAMPKHQNIVRRRFLFVSLHLSANSVILILSGVSL